MSSPRCCLLGAHLNRPPLRQEPEHPAVLPKGLCVVSPKTLALRLVTKLRVVRAVLSAWQMCKSFEMGIGDSLIC